MHFTEKEANPCEDGGNLIIIDYKTSGRSYSKEEIDKSLQLTLQQDLYNRTSLNMQLKSTLEEMGWRDEPCLYILEGRRYAYKGMKNGVAIESNLKNCEWMMYGLLRLQIGFDKGLIHAGILLLNAYRSQRSPLGNQVQLIKEEVNALYPTISLPVAVVLFDLGTPTSMHNGAIPEVESTADIQTESKIEEEVMP